MAPLELGVYFLMQNKIDYSSHSVLSIPGYCKNMIAKCVGSHGGKPGDPTSEIITVVTILVLPSYHTIDYELLLF